MPTPTKDDMYQTVVAAYNAVEGVLAHAEAALEAATDEAGRNKNGEIVETASEVLYKLVELRVVLKKNA